MRVIRKRFQFTILLFLLMSFSSAAYAYSFELLFSFYDFSPSATPDPLNVSITFEAAAIDSPWDAIADIDMTFEGYTYDVSDVGFENIDPTTTGVGGLIDGIGANNGTTNDFWFLYYRNLNGIGAASISAASQPGVIFNSLNPSPIGWMAVSDTVVNPIPIPASIVLLVTGLFSLAAIKRIRYNF